MFATKENKTRGIPLQLAAIVLGSRRTNTKIRLILGRMVLVLSFVPLVLFLHEFTIEILSNSLSEGLDPLGA
jgi:hypothetical protein